MGGEGQLPGGQHAGGEQAAVVLKARAPRVFGTIEVFYEDPKDGRQKLTRDGYNWTGWDIDEEIQNLGGRMKMSDDLKEIVGDGQGRVSAGLDIGEKEYGNGVGVSVMVSVACDQSRPGMVEGFELAAQLTEFFLGRLWERGVETYRELTRTVPG